MTRGKQLYIGKGKGKFAAKVGIKTPSNSKSKKKMNFSKPKIKSWIVEKSDGNITRINATAYNCIDDLLMHVIDGFVGTICKNAESRSIDCLSVKEAYEEFMNDTDRNPNWKEILKKIKSFPFSFSILCLMVSSSFF